MGELNKFFVFAIFLVIIESSLEQIIIPINSMNEVNEPTIVTKESFTIRGIDGSPVRVTRINVQRNSRNLNGGGGDKHTPLELMRLMDDRINSIFEELISQRIGLRIIFNDFNGGNKKSSPKIKNNNNDNSERKNDYDDNFLKKMGKNLKKKFNGPINQPEVTMPKIPEKKRGFCNKLHAILKNIFNKCMKKKNKKKE